jgi:hypothetical protein
MMKILIAGLLFSTVTMAAPTGTKKILPVTKKELEAKKAKIANEKLKILEKKEEDCDEKAKKPVEIIPEAISLSGNAGCTLPE